MVVGVLAFQGDFAEHIEVLASMRVSTLLVRSIEHLSKVDALIIPGGESTVIAQYLSTSGVGKEIQRRARSTLHPLLIYGTCAGAILLGRRVQGKNSPRPLGLIDITLHRNSYGTQTDSFEASLKVRGMKDGIYASFIRAPKLPR